MPRRLFIAIDLPKPVCWLLGQLLVQPLRGRPAVLWAGVAESTPLPLPPSARPAPPATPH